MSHMRKQNLYYIKKHFEKKTGVCLISAGCKQEADSPAHKSKHSIVPKVALIAAIVTVFMTLTAFAVTIFSTWAGDALTITASYYGSGIVWVEITNQSDKDLTLEPQMNLCYYSTQELVESTGEEPYLDAITIPAHATEKIRLDLRRTYDVAALENTKNDFYYLQITNDRFLLGQKWSCMVSFVVTDYVTPWYEYSDSTIHDGVLPPLKAYYQNFTPDIFARWVDVFDYVELVQTELDKVDGNIVRACEPPIYFDYYDWFGSTHWSTFDGYNKLLGIDDSEYYDMIGIDMPCIQDDGSSPGGGWIMPLFYLYQYNKSDITSPQDYVFMSGNLLTFEEIEPYKVYDDGEYVIYEMHHLIYTDLETYVKDMALQRDDIYLNEQIWDRIERFYEYWSQPENMEKAFYSAYNPGKHEKNHLITIPEVIELSRRGEDISFEDIRNYRGSPSGLSIYESETGMDCAIDGNYVLFYAQHLDGTLKGWYLIHTPTGDQIDIRYSDVEAFVEAHDAPLPRCSCKDTDNGNHGWTVTMDWLLKQGTSISMAKMDNNCRFLYEEEQDPDLHYDIIPIHETEEFHMRFGWSEEENKWALWLVHTESGDRCDLQIEDSTAFVEAHGGI